MKTRIITIAAACLLFALSLSGQNTTSKDSLTLMYFLEFGDRIPNPLGRVSDFEGILTPRQIQSLDSLISAYENKTGVQIAVVTIDSAMISQEEFDTYTMAIANIWGVGQKEKDNGILIGLSSTLRRVRINNGLGIEKVITDAETKKIVKKDVIPAYKKGNYFAGTLAAVQQLIILLDTKR